MASNSDVEMDTAAMWTSAPFTSTSQLHLGLQEMERSLRCPICSNFFHVPVSLKSCHHSFCSECIRDYIATYRGRNRHTSCPCPSCKQPMDVSGSDLKRCVAPNRSLESMVIRFRAIRDPLRSQLTKSETTGRSSEDKSEASPPPQARATRASRAAATITDETQVDHAHHREELAQRRRKRPTTLYKGMKKAKLAELCRKEGLNTTGNDKDLLNRHRSFIRLYNSESDSYSPRSHEELVREIHQREANKKKEARHSRGTLGEDSNANEYVRSLCRTGKCSSATEGARVLVHDKFTEMIAELRAKKTNRKKATNGGASSKKEGDEESYEEGMVDSRIATQWEAEMGNRGDPLQMHVTHDVVGDSLNLERGAGKAEAEEAKEKSRPSFCSMEPAPPGCLDKAKVTKRTVKVPSSEPIDLTVSQSSPFRTGSANLSNDICAVRSSVSLENEWCKSSRDVIPPIVLPQVERLQASSYVSVSPSPADTDGSRGQKRQRTAAAISGKLPSKKPATVRTSRASNLSPMVPWTCKFCTLRNLKYAGFCEACQKTRMAVK